MAGVSAGAQLWGSGSVRVERHKLGQGLGPRVMTVGWPEAGISQASPQSSQTAQQSDCHRYGRRVTSIKSQSQKLLKQVPKTA